MYRANGGDLSNLEAADTVLRKLKQSRSRTEEKVMAGAATGSLVDLRITYEVLPENEIAKEIDRAFWCPDRKSFQITSTPRPGIKRFYLADDLAAVDWGVDDNREGSALTYASKPGWIWNYVDAAPDLPPGPTEIPLDNVPDRFPPSTPGNQGGPSSSREVDPKPTGTSGGLAINVGEGTASASDGIALNLLSDDVSAGEGDVAVGLLHNKVSTSDLPGYSTLKEHTSPYVTPAVESTARGVSSAAHLGSRLVAGASPSFGGGTAETESGLATNLGKGRSSTLNGIAANGGWGSASSDRGLGLNAGEGSASAKEGGAINLGEGAANSVDGSAINLGSGSASAGGRK